MSPAYAYFDPGTTGSVFTFASSLFPAFLAALGFLFFPLKKLFLQLKQKFTSSDKSTHE